MKLEISGLSHRVGETPILNDVSLRSDSRALVLVGPSGGGKTSLLRILAGLAVPSAGSVTLDEQPLHFNEASLFLHRRRVGTVFQSLNLFPHLTGLENILLPLTKVYGMSRAAATTRANGYLERFQLATHAHKKPHQLSGGQRQRIAIVRAIATHPKLLLLDEPTSALDPEMTAEVLSLIEELKRDGKDFVLVTHEISFARRVADEIAFVAGGRIKQHAGAETFFREPVAEVKSFLDKILI